MELSEAKLEFEIRYYWWAISEWEKELNDSFTKLRKTMAEKFTKADGERCVKIPGERRDPWFEMKFAGWIVTTGFTFGRSESMISYSHSIGSEAKTPIPEFPPEVWPPTKRLGLHISFAGWLGICSRTQWEHLFAEAVEPACDAVLKLCDRFFDVAPKLLKGLEFETIKAS